MNFKNQKNYSDSDSEDSQNDISSNQPPNDQDNNSSPQILANKVEDISQKSEPEPFLDNSLTEITKDFHFISEQQKTDSLQNKKCLDGSTTYTTNVNIGSGDLINQNSEIKSIVNTNLSPSPVSKDSQIGSQIIHQTDSQNTAQVRTIEKNESQVLSQMDTLQVMDDTSDKNKKEQNQMILRENSMMICTQLNKQISLLSQQEKDYNYIYQMLSDILKYSPKPKKVEKDVDEEKFKYYECISSLKDIVGKYLGFPQRFNCLQNDQESKYQEFQRIQSQLTYRIVQHLEITYNLDKEDLGSLYQQNENNMQNLQNVANQWKQFSQQIVQMDVVSIINAIHSFFSEIFGLKQGYDDLSQLEKYELEINSIKMEDQNHIDEICRKFEKEQYTISSSQNAVESSKQQILAFNSLISEIQAKIKQIKKEQETDFQEASQNREKLLKQIRQEIELFNQKKKKQLDRYNLQRNQIYTKHNEKMTFLNNKYPFGGVSTSSNSSKQCFHYFIVVDESGSFTGAHNQAIQGILNFTDKSSSNDYFTFIKFESSAQVKYPKKQKSQINMNDLRSKIEPCAAGGTSFQSAFTKLKDEMQSTLQHDEYPVILFITDGQDSFDCNSIINSILSNCGEVIFYAIGYGRVNQKQLHSITNKFNNSINQQKEVNGKTINLYYQNNTPEQLYLDLIKISSNNRVSIEDIKQAKKFFESCYQDEQNTFDEFQKKEEEKIEKQLQLLYQKEQFLIQPITREAFQNLNKKQLVEYQETINDLLKQISIETQNQLNITDKIDQTMVYLFQEFATDKNKKEYDPSLLKTFDSRELLFNKIQEIKEKNKKVIKEIEKEIEKNKKEQEEILLKQKDLILQLGFQNESHFQKFYSLYKDASKAGDFYLNCISKYINIGDQLISMCQQLEQQIDFSKKNIEQASQNDNIERILEYYKKFVTTIQPHLHTDATKKILLLTKSSIYEKCLEIGELKFYEKCLRDIDFQMLFNNVDKSKQEQEKFINDELVPEFIRLPASLARNKKKEKMLQEKLNKIDRTIKNQQEELKDLKKDKKANSDDIDEINQKLSELTEQQSEIKAEIKELNKNIETELSEYSEDNYEKIKIVTQIAEALFKSILNASLKEKYMASILPFHQFVSMSLQANNELKCYKPLAIKSSN